MKSVNEAKKLAEQNFNEGLFCAESVVSALAMHQGQDQRLATKMATAFCSGLSRTCNMCGALTGAIMGVSLALGRNSNEDSVEPAYKATQELIKNFENEFGASNCSELLGCDLNQESGIEKFKADNLKTRCEQFTSTATALAVQVISKHG